MQLSILQLCFLCILLVQCASIVVDLKFGIWHSSHSTISHSSAFSTSFLSRVLEQGLSSLSNSIWSSLLVSAAFLKSIGFSLLSEAGLHSNASLPSCKLFFSSSSNNSSSSSSAYDWAVTFAFSMSIDGRFSSSSIDVSF